MRFLRSWSWCLILLSVVVANIGCRTTPITGRRQLLVMPEADEIQMGLSAFQETLASETPSPNAHLQEITRRVGNRIAQVADRPDYQWEFQLIASPQVNAFALPGGKVAIYEGILPICQNEAGLAVVMSHEIAHALARHGGERMSHEMAVTGLGKVVDWATQNRTAFARQSVATAFGIASKYGVVLPYSRKHESEADHMGMVLMARAGYDPRVAPLFWERFGQAQASGNAKIEFLSTHPADERRAAELRSLLPQAIAEYEMAAVKLGFGEQLGVR